MPLILNGLPPPKKKTLEFAQKLGKDLLNLGKQNHISGSLNEVLTIR